MGRTDVRTLTVPELPQVLPAQPVAEETPVRTETIASDAPRGAMLAPKEAPAVEQCPACKARLSSVEQKFERCLSCGKNFGGVKPTASLSVNL
jgi:Zn finger protein HypA/HybF involved in hydrogenase expression